MKFSNVLASTVVRASNKGESHGKVYLVNLDSGIINPVIDCNREDINWEGSGGERGLRGIAYYDNQIYLASHNRVHIYNLNFKQVDVIENKYLGSVHEIYIHEHTLWITSTTYDSILEFDLKNKKFIKGYCLRDFNFNRKNSTYHKIFRKLKWNFNFFNVGKLKLNVFDPQNTDAGPKKCDEFHINNVSYENGILFISPGRYSKFIGIKENRIVKQYKIPFGTHNTRLLKDGILLNNTDHREIAFFNKRGKKVRTFRIKKYNKKEIVKSGISDHIAAPYWARGLCVFNNETVIGGSSPATISVYQFEKSTPVKIINISMDVRYAIHGLELWPF